MAKSMLRHWCPLPLVFSGFLIGAAGIADAGEPILVQFSGSHISGAFNYLQAHPPTLPRSGIFNFAGSSDPHGVAYTTTNPSSTVKCVNNSCGAFSINTVANPMQFRLNATVGGTTTVIVLPTNTALLPTSLPDCSVFTGTGTLTETVGSTSTTFNITVTVCAVEKVLRVSPAPCYVCEYPAPAPCPVYVCQPRPACGLSRLFCWRTFRMGCR
jgi:hypothetical protein